MKDITIAIEGATYEGSVAVLRGADVVSVRSLGGEDGSVHRAGRGERLMPALAECMAEADVRGDDVVRIVCGSGPGSFTSLRVAGSVAKGLASGYGVDLYEVSSLLLTVAGAKAKLEPGPYLSVLDAMRGEFFALRVAVEDGSVKPTGRAGVVTTDDISELRERKSVVSVICPCLEFVVVRFDIVSGGLLVIFLEQVEVVLCYCERD
jgi:tRNA threonylcarbamoyl adenosine modification protein YeaZ